MAHYPAYETDEIAKAADDLAYQIGNTPTECELGRMVSELARRLAQIEMNQDN